jgi:hypothetical protein
LGSHTYREETCLNDSGIRDNNISCSSLFIVNKGAAINKASVVSLRKGAFLNVVWTGEVLFKYLWAGVN